ncbi:hypothetical protein DVH05_028393 [Phytophthora capsici]|nr:hypothetical protein DVH05_028393 [Phytophthora capsici]
MPHASAVNLQQHMAPTESQLQTASAGPGFTSVGINPGTSVTESNTAPIVTNVGYEPSIPGFNSAPSIFESLLREPGIGARSTAFYDDLAVFQRLATELDSAAKQKQTKAQNNYTKPNFLYQEETEATSATTLPVKLSSPVKFDDEKVAIQANNQHDSNQHTVLRSSFELLNESVFLPLGTTKLPLSLSPTRRTSWQGLTSATDNYTCSVSSLDTHSEMLPFTHC